MPPVRSFENVINLETDRDIRQMIINRLHNDLVFQSALRLRADKKALEFLKGERLLPKDNPNNIFISNEKIYDKAFITKKGVEDLNNRCYHDMHDFLSKKRIKVTKADAHSESLIRAEKIKSIIPFCMFFSVLAYGLFSLNKIPKNHIFKLFGTIGIGCSIFYIISTVDS